MGMRFLGALGNVGLFVGKRAKQGVTEILQGAGLVARHLRSRQLPTTNHSSGVPPRLGSDPIRRFGFVCAHRWAGSWCRPQPVP